MRLLSLPNILKKITLEIEEIQSKINKNGGDDESSKEIQNVSLAQARTAAAPLLDISWDAPEGVGVSSYKIYYSYDGARYELAVECSNTMTQIELPDYGEVYIKIVAYSKFRDVSTSINRVKLRKMIGIQNEMETLSVAQMGETMFYLINGELSALTPCKIEIRVDGSNWDDATIIGTTNHFPFSLSTYLSGGEHIFRARTDNDGVYGKKERTLKVNVRNPYEDDEGAIENDDIVNGSFNIPNMLHIDNRVFSPWYTRFDDMWDKDFDEVRHMTLESTANLDAYQNINMAPLTFESIWDEKLDSRQVYDSYFESFEDITSSGVISPVIDLGSVDTFLFDYDFECNMLMTNQDSTIEKENSIQPVIYIRYSEDNITWTDWQLYLRATFLCQYVQYKLMFVDMRQIDNVEISKLHQKYSVFNSYIGGSGGVDLKQVLNNILFKVE